MRKTIIAGNWKMYKTISEAIELANGLKRDTQRRLLSLLYLRRIIGEDK